LKVALSTITLTVIPWRYSLKKYYG